MARPRKDSPAPDTQLVALRLDRGLLAAVDEHARRAGITRSAAFRELVAQGLRAAGRTAKDALAPARACAWCAAAPGAPHGAECPRRPGSALHDVLAVRTTKRRP